MTRLHVFALLVIGLLATVPWPVVPDAAVWFGVPAWAVVVFAGIALFGVGLFALVGRTWSVGDPSVGGKAEDGDA